jgi:hypothetical protein
MERGWWMVGSGWRMVDRGAGSGQRGAWLVVTGGVPEILAPKLTFPKVQCPFLYFLWNRSRNQASNR